MERFWNFIDDRQIVRRVVLGLAVWMTWRVSVWGMAFAQASTLTGVDQAAVIAAVTAPVTLFAGSVFKAYLEAKNDPPAT